MDEVFKGNDNWQNTKHPYNSLSQPVLFLCQSWSCPYGSECPVSFSHICPCVCPIPNFWTRRPCLIGPLTCPMGH
jgi:hypothetical protein